MKPDEKKKYLPEGNNESGRDVCSLQSESAVLKAIENETIFEATARVCTAEHDIAVDLPCMRGIIPRCDGAIGISSGQVRDIALISRVGKQVVFTITDIKTDENGNPLALLSRKRAQELCKEKYLETLMTGDVIDARVTHLEPFGAFCDIGCGIVSLIPIDRISVSRISHPSDRFFVGQDIKAIVTGTDEFGRITLTHKELLGTWEQNAAHFSPGETVPGTVRMIEDYGCFVELKANLAGLAEPVANVKVGSRVSVYIKSIIPEKMKLKLIIIDEFPAQSPQVILPSDYYFKEDHMDSWTYSPKECSKYVGTVFE